MKVMDALKRIKSGEPVMVTLPSRKGGLKKYGFRDGGEISEAQMAQIKDFLKPLDCGLFDGAEPQTFVWAG